MKRLLVFLGALLLLAAGCSDYDTEHPDTKSNRKLFSNLTGVKADAGIREVYAYADELGFDAHYCLAFKATPEAVERIVKKMKLVKKDRVKDWSLWSDGPTHDWLPWWNIKERESSNLYHKEVEQKEVNFLWHDPKTGKCRLLVMGL